VIWNDGFRLRKRNGGFAHKLSFEEVSEAIAKGTGFFQILREHNAVSIRSFNPPREIIGRLSENFPMPWTVSFDGETGAFEISGSSPGRVTTPEYVRQAEINRRLGGKVLAVFTREPTEFSQQIDAHILSSGFEPNNIAMSEDQFAALVEEIKTLAIWDDRTTDSDRSEVLLASPWGFRWIQSSADFDDLLGTPIVEFEWADLNAAGA
jgi:hypothetical protein